MRNKDVIRFLRNADEETIQQISVEHPGLTDARKDALFIRIEQKMQAAQPEHTIPEDEEQFSAIQEPWFSRIFPAAAAAVFMLGLCGTFAGLFWMQSQMEMPSELETTESVDLEFSRAHAIGERYAADNLTESGTLWLTVKEAESDGELFRLRITLESAHAVSIADQVLDEPCLFMADNFMAAIGQKGENWITVQPCNIIIYGEQGSLPNTLILRSGETCELELWFRTDELPAEWMLVTSYAPDNSYAVIPIKEDSNNET